LFEHGLTTQPTQSIVLTRARCSQCTDRQSWRVISACYVL